MIKNGNLNQLSERFPNGGPLINFKIDTYEMTSKIFNFFVLIKYFNLNLSAKKYRLLFDCI